MIIDCEADYIKPKKMSVVVLVKNRFIIIGQKGLRVSKDSPVSDSKPIQVNRFIIMIRNLNEPKRIPVTSMEYWNSRS